MTQRAQIAGNFRFLFDPPLGETRWRVSYGGRARGGSWNFARALLIHGAGRVLRILCVREYQASIRDSVHQTLAEQIRLMGLESRYTIQQRAITGLNGTEFLFHGLKRDPHKIKSMEGVDIAWAEEAEAISAESWQALIPTIRRPGSELWVTFNPALETDPTYQNLVVHPPDRSIVEYATYLENPFLPDVLTQDAEEMRRRDPEGYEYVWLGRPWKRSEAEVLKDKWRIDDFEPEDHWHGPYLGLDFGFANDPAHLSVQWIADSRLWIEYEARGTGWDLNTMERQLRRIPFTHGKNAHVIYADSSRPETIHELRLRGFRCEAAPKWPGSVADGLEHLRSYEEIVVHPRCKGWAQDARLWRYKTDPKTGDPLPSFKDGNEHGPDSTRYALSKMIRRKPTPQIWYPGMEEAGAVR